MKTFRQLIIENLQDSVQPKFSFIHDFNFFVYKKIDKKWKKIPIEIQKQDRIKSVKPGFNNAIDFNGNPYFNIIIDKNGKQFNLTFREKDINNHLNIKWKNLMHIFPYILNGKKDPGKDNPDLYINPEKYIDKEVLPFVLKLWKRGIKTWESGGSKNLAFVIIDKKNIRKAKLELPKNIEIELGTGGFMPEDYNSNVPPYTDLVYVQWNPSIYV